MLDSTFRHQLKNAGGVKILPDHILFRKPCELLNLNTNESVLFKNLDDAYKYIINGKTIKQIIAESGTDIFNVRCDGGGSSGGKGGKDFKPSHADKKPPKMKGDLPARMNNKIKTKTTENAISEFRKKHGNSGTEHMIMVDNNGFVSQYNHGGKHSVGWIDNNKGGMVIHNHPGNGHFSDTDLLNLSTTSTRGVVATTKNGYYHVEKGTHFNSNGWAKAVRGAKMKGSDYNDAMDKWLNKNAGKYGVVYKNVKDKPAQKTTTTKKKSNKTTTPKPKKTISLSWDNNTGQGGFDF